MSDINISIPGGEKKRLLTGGKYCPDDIVVEAEGGDTEAAFEAGRNAEYDAFWDAYQDFGNRNNYPQAFYNIGWNAATFKPKYDIIVSGNAYGMFAYSKIVSIDKKIDLSSATNTSQVFYSANLLKTIHNLTISESTPWDTVTFAVCSALESIIFYGTIGTGGLNLKWSPKLNKSSIAGIINALSAKTSGLTITLSTIAVNTAFETSTGAGDGTKSSEWLDLIATKPNWTIALATA